VTEFRHEAVFYAGEDEFLAATVPFVEEAVAAGEAVLAAVPGPKVRLLESELDGQAERLCFTDMAELGRNPARIIPAWRDFVAEHAAEGRAVRGIGEPVWPGRSPAELVECERHESLLNLAFAAAPTWSLLCPYDVDALDPAVVDAAGRSHPHVTEDGVSRPSADYAGPAEDFDDPLPPPAADTEVLPFTRDGLSAVRALTARRAAAAGIDPIRRADLVLAVSELATNSVRYADGDGLARVWEEPGALLCEVVDRGHIVTPLAGRERPEPEQLGGRGLWMVNQLCDLVQIRSSDGGTVVRVHMRTAA
jgi:anti-sigma regulatory factor (Ser/Thr protein kinase)